LFLDCTIIRLVNYLNIFKEYGISISIDSIIDSKENYLDKVTTPYINAPTDKLNEQQDFQSLKDEKDFQLMLKL